MRPVSRVSFGYSLKIELRSAFTLLESALATIIIGVGVLAVMGLFEACTRQNQAGAQQTTAMLLAGHVQELMEGLPFSDPSGAASFGPEAGETLATFNDIDDFDNQTFNPPIDSTRSAVPALSQYSQVITVVPVYPNQPSSNSDEAKPELPKSAYTGAVRIRVKILYRVHPAEAPQEVYRAQWIRVDK